jgi:hypothetical protein
VRRISRARARPSRVARVGFRARSRERSFVRALSIRVFDALALALARRSTARALTRRACRALRDPASRAVARVASRRVVFSRIRVR